MTGVDSSLILYAEMRFGTIRKRVSLRDGQLFARGTGLMLEDGVN